MDRRKGRLTYLRHVEIPVAPRRPEELRGHAGPRRGGRGRRLLLRLLRRLLVPLAGRLLRGRGGRRSRGRRRRLVGQSARRGAGPGPREALRVQGRRRGEGPAGRPPRLLQLLLVLGRGQLVVQLVLVLVVEVAGGGGGGVPVALRRLELLVVTLLLAQVAVHRREHVVDEEDAVRGQHARLGPGALVVDEPVVAEAPGPRLRRPHGPGRALRRARLPVAQGQRQAQSYVTQQPQHAIRHFTERGRVGRFPVDSPLALAYSSSHFARTVVSLGCGLVQLFLSLRSSLRSPLGCLWGNWSPLVAGEKGEEESERNSPEERTSQRGGVGEGSTVALSMWLKGRQPS